MGHRRESQDLRGVGVSSHREAHRVGGPKAKKNQVGVVRVEWEQGRPGGIPECRRKALGGIPFFNGQRCPLTSRAWRDFAGNEFLNY